MREQIRRLLEAGSLDLPHPGCGQTSERHRLLFDIARVWPVSIARIVEGHVDAMSILHEAGRPAVPGALYGVWASAGTHDVHASVDPSGITLHGTKPFASGLGIVSRALVTVESSARAASDCRLLLDLHVEPSEAIMHDLTTWSTPALADANTGSITFSGLTVDGSDVVGAPGWYLSRPGFWQGSCSPAACWGGAAVGLVDAAEELIDDDPHRRAHLGAMRSATWSMQAMLYAAGHQIDEDPPDTERARSRALALRHRIERLVAEVLDRFGQCFGPRPFVHDAELGQRWMDAHLYARQQHGERELAILGSDGPDLDASDA